MKLSTWTTLLALTASPAFGAQPLKVMTYNILHGQPCSGGSLGREVGPRMDLAAEGPAVACAPGDRRHTCGLADLAPDILGMQEVSQVFVDQDVSSNQTCAVFAATGQLDPRVDRVDAYEHAADRLLRQMNGISAVRGLGSPYKARFVRDNPRILPLLPDIPLPPDDKTLSDISAEGGDVEIGVAVLSKYRIQLVTVHNLTIGAVPGETRAILHATVQIPDANGAEHAYDFYDSHLTTTGGDSPQTVLMAGEITRFITTTRRHPENPGFFTCDCNFREGELTDFPPVVSFGVPPDIEGPRAYQIFRTAGFVDSYRVAHPVVDSASDRTSGRDGLSHDCVQPLADGRIDYVWAIPSSAGKVPAVAASEIVMEYSKPVTEGCLFPSDHNGVITTFDLDTLQ